MATLSQNQIHANIAAFIERHKDDTREEAEAQSFQTDFLGALGIDRKLVAVFEQKVKFNDGSNGYIDLFWPGKILIEMKSRGKDLEKAYQQAIDYTLHLPRKEDTPRLILICDFWTWEVYDLRENAKKVSFTLPELPHHIPLFLYLAGYDDVDYIEENAVNVKAAEAMGKLHDRMEETGYTGHKLEVYLVRLLFLLFAEDTGIFDDNLFLYYLKNYTREDGSDLGPALEQLFEILDTPENERYKGLDPTLSRFPYINGGLFRETLRIPIFTKEMREALIAGSETIDWGAISPAIFGSMFQAAMNREERRALGAHYTSERNILKAIKPLFLDDLREEFNRILTYADTARPAALRKFQTKLASLKILDPACGCGNFLIVSYRELRQLELEVITALNPHRQTVLDVSLLCQVNVNRFFGIEIEDFPAQIAQVGMWLMDHLMNIRVGDLFGQVMRRIPLKQSATIRCANALQLDWEELVPKTELSYIVGNPPFIGYSHQSKEQKADLMAIFGTAHSAGKYDFVTAWYAKAAAMMNGTEIKTALVSTNSITQGEPVGTLWPYLIEEKGVHIDFAYRTFKWENEAKGKAAVHCVIIGFSCGAEKPRKLLVSSDGKETTVPHISPYLTANTNVYITNRTKPICDVPPMCAGNRPADGGNLIIEGDEYEEFIKAEPNAMPYIRKFIGADEFINNRKRWCLWLVGITPAELRSMPKVMERVEKCKQDRLASPDEGRRKLAATPTLFRETNTPASYIVVPRHSSENRTIIPIGFEKAETITSDALSIVPGATIYHFGVMTSSMHMAWTKAVCGRLEMRYRYSNKQVYNNFPWPTPTEEQKAKIEACAQAVLDARALYPNSSLADLYDPLAMPPELSKAHTQLDKEVEKAYGRRFADDEARVAFLFDLYQKLI